MTCCFASENVCLIEQLCNSYMLCSFLVWFSPFHFLGIPEFFKRKKGMVDDGQYYYKMWLQLTSPHSLD
jgi:hypothetical protein